MRFGEYRLAPNMEQNRHGTLSSTSGWPRKTGSQYLQQCPHAEGGAGPSPSAAERTHTVCAGLCLGRGVQGRVGECYLPVRRDNAQMRDHSEEPGRHAGPRGPSRSATWPMMPFLGNIQKSPPLRSHAGWRWPGRWEGKGSERRWAAASLGGSGHVWDRVPGTQHCPLEDEAGQRDVDFPQRRKEGGEGAESPWQECCLRQPLPRLPALEIVLLEHRSWPAALWHQGVKASRRGHAPASIPTERGQRARVSIPVTRG